MAGGGGELNLWFEWKYTHRLIVCKSINFLPMTKISKIVFMYLSYLQYLYADGFKIFIIYSFINL